MGTGRDVMDKRTLFEMLLGQGNVYVHLDPRSDDVVVPSTLKSDPVLTLVFGLDLPVPIPDLEISEKWVAGTLSFSRTPFWCKVPWDAVFALSTEGGKVLFWPQDVPPDVQLAGLDEAGEVDVAGRDSQRAPSRRFGVIQGGRSRAATGRDAGAADGSSGAGDDGGQGREGRPGSERGGARPRPLLRVLGSEREPGEDREQ